LKLDINFKWS